MISKIRRGGKRLIPGSATHLLRGPGYFKLKALNFINLKAAEDANLAR